MAKNFDELYSIDREFVIAGETFAWRPVHWRVYGEWFENASKEEQSEEEGKVGEEGKAGGLKLVRSYEQMVDGIALYLAPEEAERFRALAEDPEKPVTAVLLSAVFTWLTEVQANRPTDQSSPSNGGDGAVAPTLQAV